MRAEPSTDDYAQLRTMYKRYMLNNTIAKWLLARDAPTDFHVVRKERAVQLCISTQQDAYSSPQGVAFEGSDDLMFVEKCENGFALGHIWGSLGSDEHPYAALAMRAGNAEWTGVKSRKFASDIRAQDALEVVEYAWFTNDNVMVVLWRMPWRGAKGRLSEVLYFGPVQRTDIPPQRPLLVVLLQECAVCTSCDSHICVCPNTLGVSWRRHAESALSWEEKMRMLFHGNKRGVLTAFYGAAGASLRQPFISACASQEDIAYRIQQQFTKLLAKQPRAEHTVREAPLDTNSMPVTTLQEDLTMDLGQSPVSFTPSPTPIPQRADALWLESPKQSCKPSSGVGDGTAGSGGGGCGGGGGGGGNCAKPEKDKVVTCGEGDTKAEVALSTSVDSQPSARSTVELVTQQNSVCGPEKAGNDCECSAESMPDPSLAYILNSRKDLPVANAIADMSAFIEPMMEPMVGGIAQPMPRESVTAGVLRDQDRVDFVGVSGFDGQSPESSRLGGTTLPSPLPAPMLPEEPPLKKARGDTLGIGLDWGGGFDDGKGLQLGHWNIGGIPERPLSALSRALGVARSPSPLALMNGPQKGFSPSGIGMGMGVGLGLNGVGGGGGGKGGVEEELQSIGSRDGSGGTGGRTDGEGSGAGVCCEICGIRFAKRSNKLRHVQTVHNRVKQFECDLCGAKFGLKADLGRHRFRIHESRAFCCKTCGKSFAEKSQLELHVRVTHEEDSRPWECAQCRIRFGRKSSLTRHQQTVHQQARFTCRVCKKSYSQRFDAIRHERKVHGFSLNANSNASAKPSQ